MSPRHSLLPRLSDPPKGRGASSNADGHFERFQREAFDDGWTPQDPPARPLRTEVTPERARSIISRNDSPDVPFDRAVNPYRGCEHGCVYCYARPNHAYAGLSPGLDFETRLFAKEDAAALLEQEFAKPGYKPAVLMIGGVTDGYQPIERERRITRSILEALLRWRHPAGIVTKSQLVLRDLDLLAPMAAFGLIKVAVSVTTLDRRLARAMEPRAAAPHRRLETIRALAGAGVPVTLMTAPIIPALNDHELETLLAAGADAGAREAGYVALRLPREVSPLFQEWLAHHAPDRAAKVMAQVRAMRGGKDYDSDWTARMKGAGPYAQLIATRFRTACARLGLNAAKLTLRTDLFARPDGPGAQLALF